MSVLLQAAAKVRADLAGTAGTGAIWALTESAAVKRLLALETGSEHPCRSRVLEPARDAQVVTTDAIRV